MFATPCHSGSVGINYAVGLSASTQYLVAAGCGTMTSHACTSSIDNARNILTDCFMKTDCTHLLFIDDDMAWAADLPLRLLNENVDVVGVPYRKKQSKIEFTINHDALLGSIEDRPYMVMARGIGMGMTLIKREVFEKLAPDMPLYHCYASSMEAPVRMYFRHQLTEDGNDGNKVKYTSEDFYFCDQVLSHGMEVWAYVDEEITHVGRSAYTGKYSDHIGVEIVHGFTTDRPRVKLINLIGIE